ncbi:MAG: DUF5667 domain-containing protein, partial [Dehalococcoidales bacterium]|nr:DUF5667 domain-containing protein [Dehalococcoidales bacterium]
KPRRPFNWLSWQPRWMTAAIVVLIFVVVGSGTLAAASNAMPDEALYPVKLTAENIRLTLTRSDSAKTQLYAKLADKRVDEIVKMAEKGKVEQVERATDRLDAYLQKVVVLANPAGKGAGITQAPVAAPAPAATPVPSPKPVPSPNIALAPSPTTPEPKLGALQAPAPPAPGKKDATARSETAKSATSKSAANRAKVKEVIAEQALKHSEALQAALKKAPESVKPALRKAIAVSVADYRQALEALQNEDTP